MLKYTGSEKSTSVLSNMIATGGYLNLLIKMK